MIIRKLIILKGTISVMTFIHLLQERLSRYTMRTGTIVAPIYEMRTPMPVFVYGTLRPGCGNYSWALEGKTVQEQEGFLPGTSMYSNGGFPYVIEDGGEGVVGTLIDIDPNALNDTMSQLDMLEGMSHGLEDDMNHYNRYQRFIQIADKYFVKAWVYMPPKVDYDRIREVNTHLEDGDWMNRPAWQPRTIRYNS